MLDDLTGTPTVGTITESAVRPDQLDEGDSASPNAKSRHQEALDEVNRLRAELDQARTHLSLAQARAAVAERVAHARAATRLTNVAAQARLVIDNFDRLHLAGLSRKQIADHLVARRMLYDYLDQMWRDGQRHGLDQRPAWSILITLRDLAQHLTSTALDAQTHPISNPAKDSRTGRLSMTTTPSTHAPPVREDGPPTPEQLMAALVAWLSDMPAVPRALIASALAHNRWKPTLAAVCRQAIDQLVAAAQTQAVPHPYEYIANQLGVADADVDGQAITGNPTDNMQRLVRTLSPDADVDPAVQDVDEADSAPRTGAPH